MRENEIIVENNNMTQECFAGRDTGCETMERGRSTGSDESIEKSRLPSKAYALEPPSRCLARLYIQDMHEKYTALVRSPQYQSITPIDTDCVAGWPLLELTSFI